MKENNKINITLPANAVQSSQASVNIDNNAQEAISNTDSNLIIANTDSKQERIHVTKSEDDLYMKQTHAQIDATHHATHVQSLAEVMSHQMHANDDAYELNTNILFQEFSSDLQTLMQLSTCTESEQHYGRIEFTASSSTLGSAVTPFNVIDARLEDLLLVLNIPEAQYSKDCANAMRYFARAAVLGYEEILWNRLLGNVGANGQNVMTAATEHSVNVTDINDLLAINEQVSKDSDLAWIVSPTVYTLLVKQAIEQQSERVFSPTLQYFIGHRIFRSHVLTGVNHNGVLCNLRDIHWHYASKMEVRSIRQVQERTCTFMLKIGGPHYAKYKAPIKFKFVGTASRG